LEAAHNCGTPLAEELATGGKTGRKFSRMNASFRFDSRPFAWIRGSLILFLFIFMANKDAGNIQTRPV
jgi:hypothetical protein